MADNDHDADDGNRNHMKPSRGRFAKLAAAAKMTPSAFAQANIHTDSEVGKLARMYYTAQMVHGSGNARMDGSGDKRSWGDKLYQVG